jgi:hypothetical protein
MKSPETEPSSDVEGLAMTMVVSAFVLQAIMFA